MTFADYDPESFFDEMFARAGAPRAAARALTQVIDALARRASSSAGSGPPSARCCRWASPSTSTATTRAPRRSFRSTSSRASSRPPSGDDRARPEAAHPRAEPVHRRHLPRPARSSRTASSRRSCSSRPSRSAQQCVGLNPPRGIWCHITGTDLVRAPRRPVLRARGQPALSLRRLLRAGEPRR